MGVQFLQTDHGLINASFIVSMVRPKFSGGYQAEAYEINYLMGSETYQAKASLSDVAELLSGPDMPA